MISHRQSAAAYRLRQCLVLFLGPLTLLGLIAATANSQQKKSKSNDLFVTQHREAVQKNYDGVSFTVRIKKQNPRFKPGEIIPVEFTFTTNLQDAYELYGTTDHCGTPLSLDNFFLDQKLGVAEPLQGNSRSSVRIHSRNFCEGWPQEMKAAQPKVVAFALNERFRFDQPGKFRFYVTSPRILKKGGDRLGELDITSNIVEFEILPPDAKWAEQQLDEIKKLIVLPERTQEHLDACRRLRFLNTIAAAREMVRSYGLVSIDDEHHYRYGLIGSPHRAFVIEEMERRLEAPDQTISDGYLRTLSYLAASSQQKEPLPPVRPEDPEAAKVYDKAWLKQRETIEQLLVQYTERLALVLSAKEEGARAIGMGTLLRIVEDPTIQGRDKLIFTIVRENTLEIVKIFGNSPIHVQADFLGHRWKLIANTAMLPVLRRIVMESTGSGEPYANNERRYLALRRIYELSPEEGRRLILAEARRSNSRIGLAALHFLSDETLPELDEMLADGLEKSPAGGLDSLTLLCGVIERFASPAVASRVEKFSRDYLGKLDCSIQSSLLAYLLRVKPQAGVELVQQALAARGAEYRWCDTGLLKEVAKLHTTALLEEVAITRLNDSDPKVVVNAASMLGSYGSAGAEKPLWERLEKWHREWKGREKDLPKSFDTKHPKHWQKQVGVTLRQALSQSPAWLIDREKLERLRQMCLDDDELRMFNYQVGEWSNLVKIEFRPGTDEWGSARVAHYECKSLSAVREKLSQFPKGTVFVWNTWELNQLKTEEVFSEIKTIIESLGQTLERRKPQ